MRIPVLAMAVGVLAGGCQAGRESTPAVSRQELMVETRIGDETSGPEYQLTTISQVAVHGDAVFIRQQGLQEIRVFAFDGRHRQTIGRSGAGPGEFAGLESFGIVGDTVWSIDGDLRRISLFGVHGPVIATIPFTAIPTTFGADRQRYFPYPKVLSIDGTVLGFGGWSGRDVEMGVTTHAPLLLMSRTGETQDTLGWVPLGNDHLILRGSRSTMYRDQPFSDAPITEYGATAGGIFVIDRTDPADPNAASVHVTALRATGDTLWSVHVPYGPVPLSRLLVDSIRTGLQKELGTRIPADVLERELYVPVFRAPVTAALAAEDGSLWLRWDEQTRAATWSVIGADGRLAAEVTVAPTVRLRWVSGEVAWGEELDENDVPTLVRYRIVPSRQ